VTGVQTCALPIYEEDKINDGAEEVIKLVNVHKTYLLGLEGVPALRGVG
jgi:hypothetical protein